MIKKNSTIVGFLLFAGRTDMLTLMAMRWNQQKLDNLATTLTHRYQKVVKFLMFVNYYICCDQIFLFL